MKILITGATGFIGSHLADRLLSEGHQVKLLVRPTSNRAFIKDLDTEIITGDIADAEIINQAVKDCQRVYHLATHRPRTSRKTYQRVNLDATINVAQAVLKSDVERLVFAGSAGIYGIIKHPPVNETTPPTPLSMYHYSKWQGEKLLSSYYEKENLPVVTARITSTFGPRAINWLNLCQAIAKRQFYLIGSGENYHHLLYISDAIEGLIRCSETRNIEGQSYLLAGQEPIKIKDFVKIISEEVGVELPPDNMPKLPFQVFLFLCKLVKSTTSLELPYTRRYNMFFSNRIFDISKAQKELDFEPKISTSEGLHYTIKWYLENGWL